MNTQETASIIHDIITKAQEDQALTFKPIQSWAEFRHFQRYARSTKIIIKVLKTSAKSLFKEHCRDVIAGISDVTKLLTYKQLLTIIAFYKNELSTINTMLDEYDEYLGNLRNFIYAFLGGEREI